MQPLKSKTIRSAIYARVEEFIQKYGYLPGDLPDAEKIFPNCINCNPPKETAGDWIIGEADFTRTLRHRAPAKPNDEHELFWRHLEAAGLHVKRSHPYGRLIVGYADGEPLPENVGFGNTIKGHILVLMSEEVLDGAAVNARGKQPFTPFRAFRFDCNNKCDDQAPDTGRIQAYGAPECVMKKKTLMNGESKGAESRYYINPEAEYVYNIQWEGNGFIDGSKDCGLIFKMIEEDDVLEARARFLRKEYPEKQKKVIEQFETLAPEKDTGEGTPEENAILENSSSKDLAPDSKLVPP